MIFTHQITDKFPGCAISNLALSSFFFLIELWVKTVGDWSR